MLVSNMRDADRVMNALSMLQRLGTKFDRLVELAKRHDYTIDVWHHNVRRGRRDAAAVAVEVACR